MADFLSSRFGKSVWLTRHARRSMEKRQIDLNTLQLIVESGEIKYKTASDVWIYSNVAGRTDNLICAAAVVAEAVVIKTVMINWEIEDES